MTNDTPELRILIVGASSDETSSIVSMLVSGGYKVKPKCAYNTASFDSHLRRHAFDLIFWSDSSGTFALSSGVELLSKCAKSIPIIELRQRVTELDRVNALKVGARDVVVKSNIDHLLLVAERELTDLSHRRRCAQLQRRYVDSQRTCFELLQSSRNAVAFVREGRHLFANPAYRQLFGYSYMTELKGLPMSEIVSAHDARRIDDFLQGLERSGGTGEIEVGGVGPGGAEFEVQLKVARASLNGEEAFRVLAKDLTWRTSTTRLPAHHDHLTGLVSHTHFLELLETEVSATHEQGGLSLLLLVELEHFRSIRDAVGIAAADQVIKELAEVVHGSIGGVNTLARFADHTFTLFVPNSDIERGCSMAERIRSAVEGHICDVSGRSVSSTCSIGVVSISRATHSAQEALTQADLACRAAIRTGGNGVTVYDPADFAESVRARSSVSGTEIREAMDRGRLSLSFQPIVSLHGQMAEVFQVQIQLTDEFGNLVEHEALMNSALEQEVGLHLDRWIVEQLLDTLQQPNGPGARAHLFVRLSDESVKEPTLVLHLGRLLKQSGVDASRLIFEVSESAATGQVRFAKGFVTALKRLGCRAALARYAAGSNSFRALKHLDVDFLKIDESITADILDNPHHLQELKSIQSAARAMNKVTVASLVQDANSLALLWEHGVGYVQGDFTQGPVIEIEHLGELEPGFKGAMPGHVH